LFDREPAKAQQLAARLEGRIKTSVTSGIEEALRDAVGVVNGSLVGMLPNLGTPVPDALLHAGLRVADAVYSPLWTPKGQGRYRRFTRTPTRWQSARDTRGNACFQR
jgi:shikimate dehydrogenase